MLWLHQVLLYLHISLGALSLVTFWLPLWVRKGGDRHRLLGRWFVTPIRIIAVSGILLCLIVWPDPISIRLPDANLTPTATANFIAEQRQVSEFLLLLSVLVLGSVNHGMSVLKVRQDRHLMRNWRHVGLWVVLLLISVRVGWQAQQNSATLFLIFSGIGLVASVGSLHYLFKKKIKQREWIIEHLSALLGCGIAVYTAFFAFGGRRLLIEIMPQNWLLFSWMLAPIIGTVLTIYAKRRYKAQYRVTATPEVSGNKQVAKATDPASQAEVS